MGLMVAVVVSGCATSSGPSDEDLIKASLAEWKAGFEAKDLEKIMAPVSEKFTHYEWTDKATLQAFLGGVMDQGEMDDAEVDLQYAEYKKNDDGTYTVYPVEIVAVFGSATIEAKYAKEGDAWKIVSIEVEGI